MSEDKTLRFVEGLTSDFTEKDLKQIEEYKEAGLPDIATVDAVKLTRIMDMYLSGRPYRNISMVMSMPKSIILYLSYKYNWFELRQEYMIELENSIRNRLLDAKIMSQDFLLQLQQMWQKKIGKNITKYLATDNEEFANAIDLKDVDKYMKTVEILQKLSSERVPGQSSPVVGLNMGDGVNIIKTGENSVEITPKQKVIGDLLKQFADSRREEENKPK